MNYLKSKTTDLHDDPKAIIPAPQTFETMGNASGILKLISIGEDDIKNGNVFDQEDVFEKLEEQLKER